MRRIVWVTLDSFIDCNINFEILSDILKIYVIYFELKKAFVRIVKIKNF